MRGPDPPHRRRPDGRRPFAPPAFAAQTLRIAQGALVSAGTVGETDTGQSHCLSIDMGLDLGTNMGMGTDLGTNLSMGMGLRVKYRVRRREKRSNYTPPPTSLRR
jgi:hypothetical protein